MALTIKDQSDTLGTLTLPPQFQLSFERAYQLQRDGDWAQARSLYEAILERHPGHLDTLQCLGAVAIGSGEAALAVELISKVITALPNVAALHCNLAVALYKLGRLDDALAGYDKALALDSGIAQAHNNRGNVLHDLKRLDEALASLDRALALRPDYAEALNNRGNVLVSLKRFDAAIVSYDRALALKPRYAEAYTNRGNALYQANQPHDAIASCTAALAIDPNCYLAHSVIGQCLTALGRIEEAVAHFDAALALKPDCREAIEAKIFTLDFAPGAGFAQHRDVRRLWWREVGARIAARTPRQPFANTRDPQRRIVVGYVSSDFRTHSAGIAFKPVLQYCDRAEIETVCYSCSVTEDALTAQFRAMAEHWRDASVWTDDQLGDQIRRDHIDILVDLSGFTSGHRLEVFARKPAPIQVHGWGHATPPGLATMDYVFSDPVGLPPQVRSLFSETIVDLPCLVTLDPLPGDVLPGELPALGKGTVTFGVFNRISKISDLSAQAWAQILARVPGARLVIKHWGLDDARMRADLVARLARFGAPPERIDLLGTTSRQAHLAALNSVDICLDPFPQNGGVSTWEALQMGVPVVALLGEAVPSRLAAAVLTAVGMTDWIADSVEAYVELAVVKASRADALAELRRALPGRILASPAGNPAIYAAHVTRAYRQMWQSYCATTPG